MWCNTLWGLSSHLSLIFLFPWKALALTRTRSPGFKSMAPISGCSTISVIEPLPSTGSGPLGGWPLIGLRQQPLIHTHAWQRCLSWGPLCSLRWGSKSWLGALACIQILNNVDYTLSQQIRWHCRHALFQPDVLDSQPLCLLPASWSFA